MVPMKRHSVRKNQGMLAAAAGLARPLGPRACEARAMPHAYLALSWATSSMYSCMACRGQNGWV